MAGCDGVVFDEVLGVPWICPLQSDAILTKPQIPLWELVFVRALGPFLLFTRRGLLEVFADLDVLYAESGSRTMQIKWQIVERSLYHGTKENKEFSSLFLFGPLVEPNFSINEL